jgi:adenylate cyclase
MRARSRLRIRREHLSRPLWLTLVVAAGVSLLLLPLLFFVPWRLTEARVYDFFSIVDPPRPSEAETIVVAVDEPSFAEIGQQWPWPRELHARLTESLRAAGAKAIAFDIVFAEPSRPEQDARFAEAMGEDVVLASDESVVDATQATQLVRVEPLDMLTEAGAAPGLASVALDGDGVLRRIPRAPDSFAATILRLLDRARDVPPVPRGALIQTFGPDRTYPTISYYQALEPETFLPPDYFRGKTAIIGVNLQTAPTVEQGGVDAFASSWTPFTGRLTSGAEMQATILDNLRHRLFAVPAPLSAEIGLVLLAGAAGALAALRRATWRTALAVAGLVLVTGGASYLALRYGRVWAPPLLPALALVAVASTAAALDFATERRTRRRIARAFEQYLAPEMVDRLTRDPNALRLGGERRMLTVLFSDVRGFTSIAESLKDDPARLTRLVNRLLDPLSEAVLAAGGTIDKYIGDCIMAFWNAPLDDPDHARHAVECAGAMLAAVERLNAELAAEGGDAPRLAIGVGINTGECIVGNMGSRRRFDYTALGDAVNLASRLESVTKEYRVPLIVGAETQKQIDRAFVTLELDRMAVRGRTVEEPIYAVLATRSGEEEDRWASLLDRHARFLESIRAGDTAAGERLARECASLAPDLAEYYSAQVERPADRAPSADRTSAPRSANA